MGFYYRSFFFFDIGLFLVNVLVCLWSGLVGWIVDLLVCNGLGNFIVGLLFFMKCCK